MRHWAALSLALCLGCESLTNGSGAVEGFFGVVECRRAGDREPESYGFEAKYLGTRRHESNLQIAIWEHPVDFEETDGVMILINELDELTNDTTRPLVRPIVRGPSGVNLTLNLFQSCPSRPTLHGISGEIRFDKLDVAVEPEDTGILEVLAGTVTASVVSADPAVAVGWVRARFDFLPPKPPLSPQR